MTRRCLGIIVAGVLCAVSPSPDALALQIDSCPADTGRQFGLVIDVQAAPNLSSLSSYRDGGYTASLGFGLNISPRFLLTLNVYTGNEHVPREAAKPSSGYLPLGGASLEATVFFTVASFVRPYAACGFGLFTYLDEQAGGRGYNGGGPHFEGGVQLEISRYLAIRAGAQYARIWFHDPVGAASLSPGFVPFMTQMLGGVVRVSFFPSVLP